MLLKTIQSKNKKIHSLTQKKYLMKKKFLSMKEIINDLRQKNLIAEKAVETLEVILTKTMVNVCQKNLCFTILYM